MGGFHNLHVYSEAVCKLHICCVRMNIIPGSLAKGGGGLLALGGKLLEYTASCVSQGSALNLPNSDLQL